MVDDLGLSGSEAGLVVAVEMLSVGLVTLGSSLRIGRWNRRTLMLVGLCMMLLGNLLSALATTLLQLASARIVAAIGIGVIMAAMKATVAAARNPVRIFGLQGIYFLAFSIIGFPVMAPVIKVWGLSGAYIAMALLVIPGFAWVRWVPPFSAERLRLQPASWGFVDRWTMVVLVALLAYFIGRGAVWIYLERLGIAAGLSIQTIANVLAGASVGGILGALLATRLNTRLGIIKALTFGMGCSLGSLLLLVYGMSIETFLPAVVIFNFAFAFTMPYLLGALSHIDPHGRIVVLGFTMQTAGLALGPALAAVLLVGNDYTMIGWLGMVFFGASFILFRLALLRLAPSLKQPHSPVSPGKRREL